jgi:hypothetical protein
VRQAQVLQAKLAQVGARPLEQFADALDRIDLDGELASTAA